MPEGAGETGEAEVDTESDSGKGDKGGGGVGARVGVGMVAGLPVAWVVLAAAIGWAQWAARAVERCCGLRWADGFRLAGRPGLGVRWVCRRAGCGSLPLYMGSWFVVLAP